MKGFALIIIFAFFVNEGNTFSLREKETNTDRCWVDWTFGVPDCICDDESTEEEEFESCINDTSNQTINDICCKLIYYNETCHYPDPSDCSKFFTCNHGEAVSFTCSYPLYWNEIYDACDWPYYVDTDDCTEPPPPSTATEQSSTAAPTTKDEANNNIRESKYTKVNRSSVAVAQKKN